MKIKNENIAWVGLSVQLITDDINFKLFFNEYFSFSWVGAGDKSFF